MLIGWSCSNSAPKVKSKATQNHMERGTCMLVIPSKTNLNSLANRYPYTSLWACAAILA